MAKEIKKTKRRARIIKSPKEAGQVLWEGLMDRVDWYKQVKKIIGDRSALPEKPKKPLALSQERDFLQKILKTSKDERRELERIYFQLSDWRKKRELVSSLAENYINFFGGLPEGWKVKVSPAEREDWFVLQVPIAPFLLEDKGLEVMFSNLLVVMRWYREDTIIRLEKEKGKQVHPGPSRRLHPHGRDGTWTKKSINFCLGNGEEMIRKVIDRGDFTSLFWSFLSLVHNYRRDRAYQPLESFTNIQGCRCGKCEKWILKEEIPSKTEKCLFCGLIYCKKCAKKEIKEAKMFSCKICKRKGEKEKKEKESGQTIRCSQCQASQPICNNCRELVCVKHAEYCHRCGGRICLDCSIKCPVCNHLICPNCLSYEEEYRKYGICKSCEYYQSLRVEEFLKQVTRKGKEKEIKK